MVSVFPSGKVGRGGGFGREARKLFQLMQGSARMIYNCPDPVVISTTKFVA
jgi:hypothetical protein